MGWSSIQWEQSVDGPGMPLSHYPQLQAVSLDPEVRVALGRLFACFTCELFIHFERYLIDYLTRHRDRVAQLPDSAIQRFVEEEQVHTEAFERLLNKLRPDLYPSGKPRFLQRRAREDWVLSKLSPVSLFTLAMLFEEITLFVPEAIDADSDGGGASLVREIMELHASDEHAHVDIDERVLTGAVARQSRVRSSGQVLLSLPVMLFVDRQVERGFRKMVRHASTELSLPREIGRALLQRSPTVSDRLGALSFADKFEALALPCSGFVSQLLRQRFN